MVSKELAQAAGWHNVPILGAAQVNRTGQLGGTISLEQDADLILELRKVGKAEGIRQNLLVKSRHTPLHPTLVLPLRPGRRSTSTTSPARRPCRCGWPRRPCSYS